uniref:DNA-directed RNA polymerase n=1 Tax=viral metagenome TaxID=1070528 RepID=A0A6C0BCJ2_9ZZZZ
MAEIERSITNEFSGIKEETSRIRKYLTKEQINDLLNVFVLPQNNMDIVLNDINAWIRSLAFHFMESVKIYPEMFNEFKEHLRKKFLTSLMEAETPIGANTSDAIGQQATQALLNTFHSVGTAKSGGPDGINENISISSKRQILYSMIHLKNGKMSYKDVMDLKKEFIGLTIKKLLIEEPIPYIVDIGKEFDSNPFNPNLSQTEKNKIVCGKGNWWYNMISFDGVYDREQNKGVKRTCIRLKFDIQKLYDYNLLISEIASFISKWKFEIKISKRTSKSSKKHDDVSVEVVAVPSPSNKGIIDIFIKSFDEMKDHLLISLIHSNEFNSMMTSGIDKISNFYAVKVQVKTSIRDISETSRFDEENGKKGTWVYLKDNRFDGVPYFRVIELLEAAGLNVEIPYYNKPNSYRENKTTLPLDYYSHKSCPELVSEMKIRAYLFDTMTEHQHPFTVSLGVGSINGQYLRTNSNIEIKHYQYEKINSGFEVALYQYAEIESIQFNSLCNRKFKNKGSLSKFINEISNRLTLKQFQKYFGDNEGHMTSFFKTKSSDFKTVGFEINQSGDSKKYVVFYLFQLNYIDYQLKLNLDYINSRFVTMSLDSVLMKHFAIPYEIANKNGISLPDNFRIPKRYDVVRIDPLEKRIFVKDKMFFTDRYDFLGDPNREKMLKDPKKKLKPLDRLMSYLTRKTNADEQTYVYGEGTGSNLSDLLKNEYVNGSKTFCNDFYQTYHTLGHECLRNLLSYDMIQMINSSGYISVNYINFVADTITHNGINPMTSEGISCQGRDFLSMITFDNAAKYIMLAALSGESKSVNSTSSSIFLGKKFKLGTGAVEIGVDKTKINMKKHNDGISEGFLKLSGIEKPTTDLFLPDGSDDPINIPKLIIGRMNPIGWIIDRFIDRDILYYVQRGIDDLKRITYQVFTKYSSDDELDFADDGFDLTLITIGTSKRP